MNPEQLQVIKEHFENVPEGWPVNEGSVIGQMKEDGMALIAEVERLQNIIIFERRESLIKIYESIGAEDVEIKRLREALEKVQEQLFSIRGLDKVHDSEITGLCAEIRKALEGTK